MKQTKILLIEKPNSKYRMTTQTRQVSGLSVCIQMLADSVEGITRVVCDNLDQMTWAVDKYKPSRVIFQALFATANDFAVLKSKFKNIKFFFHIHSDIPFLAAEATGMARLNEAKKHGIGIIVNSQNANRAIPGSWYLPNVYNKKFQDPKEIDPKKETIDIICGGSLRQMKNQLAQAMAAIDFADRAKLKLRFHCNMSRSEGGEEVKANLKALFHTDQKHELINIGWLEHQDFINYCRTCDIGMQVSLTESFNIVAADYIAAGIPLVGSNQIPWIEDSCSNHESMVKKLAEAFAFPTDNVLRNSVNLRKYNEKSISMWEAFRDS